MHTVCTSEFAEANIHLFEKRNIEPHFLETAGELNAARMTGRYARRVKGMEQGLNAKSPSRGPTGWVKRLIFRHLMHSSAYAIAREWRISGKFRKKQKQALNLLGQLKTDVVLSLSDRTHDYVEGPILWASQKRGVPVVLPFVAQFDLEAAFAYRHDAESRPLPNLSLRSYLSIYKFFTYLHVKSQIYKGLFFQAPYILTAARKAGFLSSYPWWNGNGLSDVVCVDSPRTAEQFVRNRVVENKIALTGHVRYDSIYRSLSQRTALRKSLFKKYTLDDGAALLLLSVPQYAEQGYMGWDDHWLQINEIIRNASAAGENLLLSIHPRSNVQQYMYLEQRFKCRIVEEPLADIIGAADVFLASNSTTLVWSVLCGIPTVDLKSPVRCLYEDLTSITHACKSENLAGTIKDLLSSNEINYISDWRLLGRDLVFDGRYLHRFYSLLERSISEQNH